MKYKMEKRRPNQDLNLHDLMLSLLPAEIYDDTDKRAIRIIILVIFKDKIVCRKPLNCK